MPYNSILFVANLTSLAARRDEISRKLLWTLLKLPSVYITSFLHRGTNHLLQGSEVKKNLLGYIPVLNDTAHSFTICLK